MPFQSKYTTNDTLIFDRLIRAFLVEETLPPSTATIASWFQNRVSVKFLTRLKKNFTHIHRHTHTHTHTHTLSLSLSLIRLTACARVQFSGNSSTTNSHSETGQMAVCCQNLTLGTFSSRSALSMLFGALFKKFRLYLNTPRMLS